MMTHGSLTAKVVLRWILAGFFVCIGVNQFRMFDGYTEMVPYWMPWPAAVTVITGACKILGGICLLVPRLRNAAGIGLITLLVVMFPANLHVALLGHMPGYGFSPFILWLRIPFQAVLVAWIFWVAPREPRPAA
jgi:uncharacterized membrane protein